MADFDLGPAILRGEAGTEAVRNDASRWLVRNGHSDLLEVLGLVETTHLCPYCGKRPWMGNSGSSVCQRSPCQQARGKRERAALEGEAADVGGD